MQLEDYFNFLAPNDIRIKGHRIGIESVLYEYVHHAQTPEEIGARFPTLSLEQVYAVILFYLHNRDELSRYLAEWLAHGERMRAEQDGAASPVIIRLRETMARTAVVGASPARRASSM